MPDNQQEETKAILILTEEKFIEKLSGYRSDKLVDKIEKYFKGNDGVTKAFGVKFDDVFITAKLFSQMPLHEIEILLESDFYEIRMGAVSIMDYQARYRRATDEQKKGLFDLYIRRHDRINNWDLVDRGAGSIIGEYLTGKPKDILYTLAASKNTWERRTAIVSTSAFIKNGNTDETFHIAEMLLNDDQELINKAVGSGLREAGKKHREKLITFLDKYAITMPRVTLRYAVEQFDKEEKEYYVNLKKESIKQGNF